MREACLVSRATDKLKKEEGLQSNPLKDIGSRKIKMISPKKYVNLFFSVFILLFLSLIHSFLTAKDLPWVCKTLEPKQSEVI